MPEEGDECRDGGVDERGQFAEHGEEGRAEEAEAAPELLSHDGGYAGEVFDEEAFERERERSGAEFPSGVGGGGERGGDFPHASVDVAACGGEAGREEAGLGGEPGEEGVAVLPAVVATPGDGPEKAVLGDAP